ncbi:hypothetical protein CDL12_03741 [Handroanthus impetiginosus]|uniref:Uncharacterized protein n=1 Tax=Handroanthus impetiginosus TaxID=429701 RepID=A0A2G9I193_9LAMI|nr:hypothetical protein CDL12_03741 [Handroanthus impetiginosus]
MQYFIIFHIFSLTSSSSSRSKHSNTPKVHSSATLLLHIPSPILSLKTTLLSIINHPQPAKPFLCQQKNTQHELSSPKPFRSVPFRRFRPKKWFDTQFRPI